MLQRVLFFPCLLQFFVVQTIQQQNNTTLITCYDWGGTPFPNNYQCPDSHACCGHVSECTPNRFCVRGDEIIRPTCSFIDFEDCSLLCHYTNCKSVVDGLVPIFLTEPIDG